jgi:hypothetical protein
VNAYYKAVIAAVTANHNAIMNAIVAISRPFAFGTHCAMVREANRKLVGPHTLVNPLPVPAPVGANPLQPAAKQLGQLLDTLKHSCCGQQVHGPAMDLPRANKLSVRLSHSDKRKGS